MPSGFVNRWIGKVMAKSLWIGSGGLTVANSTNRSASVAIGPNSLASLQHQGLFNGTASTAALAVLGYGITKLSSIGGSTYNIGAPIAGMRAVIYTDAIGDGVRKVSSTVAGGTFQSTLASANFLNFSTVVTQTIELLGLSTAAWAIKGNVGSVTVSTS